MVEPFLLNGHILRYIAQALSAGKLSDHHRHELAPAIVGSEFLSGMMNGRAVIEIMSGNKCSNLTEDCVIDKVDK